MADIDDDDVDLLAGTSEEEDMVETDDDYDDDAAGSSEDEGMGMAETDDDDDFDVDLAGISEEEARHLFGNLQEESDARIARLMRHLQVASFDTSVSASVRGVLEHELVRGLERRDGGGPVKALDGSALVSGKEEGIAEVRDPETLARKASSSLSKKRDFLDTMSVTMGGSMNSMEHPHQFLRFLPRKENDFTMEEWTGILEGQHSQVPIDEMSNLCFQATCTVIRTVMQRAAINGADHASFSVVLGVGLPPREWDKTRKCAELLSLDKSILMGVYGFLERPWQIYHEFSDRTSSAQFLAPDELYYDEPERDDYQEMAIARGEEILFSDSPNTAFFLGVKLGAILEEVKRITEEGNQAAPLPCSEKSSPLALYSTSLNYGSANADYFSLAGVHVCVCIHVVCLCIRIHYTSIYVVYICACIYIVHMYLCVCCTHLHLITSLLQWFWGSAAWICSDRGRPKRRARAILQACRAYLYR